MVIYKKHNKNTTHIAIKRLKIVKKLIVYNNNNDDNKSRNKKSPMCLGDLKRSPLAGEAINLKSQRTPKIFQQRLQST